ncbi:hypothetical protein FRC12_022638, partial [Ceratobasidium sp. 428]
MAELGPPKCNRCERRSKRSVCDYVRPRCTYCADRGSECGYPEPAANANANAQGPEKGGIQGGQPLIQQPPLTQPPDQQQGAGAAAAITEQVVNRLLDTEAIQEVINAQVQASLAALRDRGCSPVRDPRHDRAHRRRDRSNERGRSDSPNRRHHGSRDERRHRRDRSRDRDYRHDRGRSRRRDYSPHPTAVADPRGTHAHPRARHLRIAVALTATAPVADTTICM